MCECLHYEDGEVYLCVCCAAAVQEALEIGAGLREIPGPLDFLGLELEGPHTVEEHIRSVLSATWGLPEDQDGTPDEQERAADDSPEEGSPADLVG